LLKITKALLAMTTLIGLIVLVQETDMDRKKVVPLLGKEGPFGDAATYFRPEGQAGASNQILSDKESQVAGSLAIFAMRDPTFRTFSRGLSGIDRYLDLRLNGDEWDALYLQVLRCPDAGQVPRLPNEDTAEWHKRFSEEFQQAIPTQPMLARIYDLFIYVSYAPHEIEQLSVECVKLEATTSNEKARSALAKVIAACNEASKLRVGLMFVPD
jgi:hypothetical protein